ncbi:MAG: hypothetical protein U5L45_20680 [Saprospiraceae bacterium]|nr:hypothetical protein [Saprospiraceae bacterium]
MLHFSGKARKMNHLSSFRASEASAEGRTASRFYIVVQVVPSLASLS